MGRHTKLPPTTKAKKPRKRRQATPAEPVDPLAQRAALLQHELAATRGMCEAIDKVLEAGEATPALARERAGLVRSMAQISAEMRQIEKQQSENDAALKPAEVDELVAEYLREIPRTRRSKILATLGDLEADKHLLAH